MASEHITFFEIKNFKKFNHITLDNLGQFNLIVGDNNVGKTSILEALLFSNDKTELLKNYHKTLCFRKLHIHPKPIMGSEDGQVLSIELPDESYLSYLLKDENEPLLIRYKNDKGREDIKLKLEPISIHEKTTADDELMTTQIPPNFSPEHWVRFYINDEKKEVDWVYRDDFVVHKKHIPFIPAHTGYGSDLMEYYYANVHNSKASRKNLSSNLKLIIPNIEEVLPHKINGRDMLAVSLKNQDKNVPITRYGDGTIRMVRILLEITNSKHKRLMIDEISDGIHHSRLVEFWKTIIKSCRRNNVQLFATTHSLECLKAYIEAVNTNGLKKNKDESRCIKLVDMNGQTEENIKAYTYPYHEFETLIETETEIRG